MSYATTSVIPSEATAPASTPTRGALEHAPLPPHDREGGLDRGHPGAAQ